MSNWRKTSEELPEQNVKVLCRLQNGYVILATLRETDFEENSIDGDIFDFNEAPYWCPIPKFDL